MVANASFLKHVCLLGITAGNPLVAEASIEQC
jgi:hypothetical protein